MNPDPLQPGSLEELAALVKSHPRVTAFQDDPATIRMNRISGVTQYDPSEFTFTAWSGTPLSEIVTALAANGQYLPFDPPFTGTQSIGWTVNMGLSGPGAYRYGGVRDFILAIQYLDGAGQLLRSGGKVVKNVAGFDLPKFFTGGLGCYGILTEVTFKVFPCPPALVTLAWPCDGIAQAVEIAGKLGRGPWDLDAVELESTRVLSRIRGRAESLPERTQAILSALPGGHQLPDDEAGEIWRRGNTFDWAPLDANLVKAPVTLGQCVQVAQACERAGMAYRLGIGGNVAWIAAAGLDEVDRLLRDLNFRGLIVRGPSSGLIGTPLDSRIARDLKSALDPGGRFPHLQAS